MIQGNQPPGGQWRFLQLTIFICGWMLLSPLFKDRWITQVMLAVIEATVGQFYIAVIVAVFVGIFAAQRHKS